jgi:fatty acid desaturase
MPAALPAPDKQRPMRAAEYRRRIAHLVDVRAQQKSQAAVLHLVAHVALLLSIDVWVAMHLASVPLPVLALLGLLAGHSVMVAAFAAHEIGHGAGAMPVWLRKLWLQLGYAPAVFAVPTVQRKAHNQLHHTIENTPRDPDRRITLDEIRVARAEGIGVWLFPNSRHPIASAVTGFAMSVFSYHLSIFWHSVLRTGEIYDMRLDARNRRNAVLQALCNLALQLGLVALSGFSWLMVAFLALQYFVGASGAGLYIATNHLLCGMADEAHRDPLANTVSLAVPRWVDFLHLSFSHHVEHHVFPGASYHSLPAIRRALQQEFPDRYRLLSWPAALRTLLGLPLVVLDKNTLVHPSGLAPQRVPFPSHDEGRFAPGGS